MNKIIDFTFGINNQALAVMHMLDREPDFADYENGSYKTYIKTQPWYNGRESGFVISMKEHQYDGKCLHIAVFEHRNSDRICALRWETDGFYFNHPLEDPDIFAVAYGGVKKSKYDVAYQVKYGESGKMADWVYNQLESFYKSKENKK